MRRLTPLEHLRSLLGELSSLKVDPVHIVFAPDARVTISVHLRSRTHFERVCATRQLASQVTTSALGTRRAERAYFAQEPLIGGGTVEWHAYSTPRESDWDTSHTEQSAQPALWA